MKIKIKRLSTSEATLEFSHLSEESLVHLQQILLKYPGISLISLIGESSCTIKLQACRLLLSEMVDAVMVVVREHFYISKCEQTDLLNELTKQERLFSSHGKKLLLQALLSGDDKGTETTQVLLEFAEYMQKESQSIHTELSDDDDWEVVSEEEEESEEETEVEEEEMRNAEEKLNQNKPSVTQLIPVNSLEENKSQQSLSPSMVYSPRMWGNQHTKNECLCPLLEEAQPQRVIWHI